MQNTVTLLVQKSLIFVHPIHIEVKHSVHASAKPQTAPAWITASSTYKAAFSEGSVYAINYVAPPPMQEKKEDKKLEEAKLGFSAHSTPTIDSLVKEGVNLQEAQDAILSMGGKSVETGPAFKDLYAGLDLEKPKNLKFQVA